MRFAVKRAILMAVRALRKRLKTLGCKVDCRTQRLEDGGYEVVLKIHSIESMES